MHTQIATKQVFLSSINFSPLYIFSSLSIYLPLSSSFTVFPSSLHIFPSFLTSQHGFLPVFSAPHVPSFSLVCTSRFLNLGSSGGTHSVIRRDQRAGQWVILFSSSCSIQRKELALFYASPISFPNPRPPFISNGVLCNYYALLFTTVAR